MTFHPDVHPEEPTLETVLDAWTALPEGTPLRLLVIHAEYADRDNYQTVHMARLVGMKRPSRTLAEGVGKAKQMLGSVMDTRAIEVSWWFAPEAS